jgi:hypothetical protein
MRIGVLRANVPRPSADQIAVTVFITRVSFVVCRRAHNPHR